MMRSFKAPTPSTATSGQSGFVRRSHRTLSEASGFTTQRSAKLNLNSSKQVKSANLFVNEEKIIIKNLATKEPLSHLVDDEQIIDLLGMPP